MQRKTELHSGDCKDICQALPHSGKFLVTLRAMKQYSSHLRVHHIHCTDLSNTVPADLCWANVAWHVKPLPVKPAPYTCIGWGPGCFTSNLVLY